MRPHPDLTNVCLTCGLCCDGTFLKRVQLEEGDEASRLSLFQITSVAGTCYFQLPCFAFDQKKGCRIYDVRPIKCRNYSCKLLLLLIKKEISSQSAIALIEQTKQLKTDLFREAEQTGIDRKYFINTSNLVDHIEKDLCSGELKNTYGDLHVKCSLFSDHLVKYFKKDQPVG